MKTYRVLIVSAAALLLPFCLAPNVKAQSTSGSMMHNSEMMTHNTSMSHSKATMSDPTGHAGDRMGKMHHGTTEHMKSGHMMGNHMTEAGHGDMSDGGSAGEMTH
jgi:hypothetical protein